MVDAMDSAEARKLSKTIRENWLQQIANGEVGIDDVIAYSRTGDREAGYVAKIRLISVLERMDGWSESAATNVLLKNGFKQNDTIRTLRSYIIKASKFKHIFELPAPSFASTRPDMPKGWPWQGKLADLVRVTGKEIPSLDFEGTGTGETPERKSPLLTVPGVRSNPRTGEIIDPKPFWEPKALDVPEQPLEPLINDDDISALFGDNAENNKVDDDDIEALLS